jgi:stress response protein YsnF
MSTDAPVEVVRSEEQLQIHTVSVPVERVRVQKVIVTEERTITVTVRREELRMVRETVRPGEEPPEEVATFDSGDRVIDMVLHEEQIVIGHQVVPVERVQVVVDRVVTQQPVTTELSHEEVDVSFTP